MDFPQELRVDLPEFTLPLTYAEHGKYSLFPNALDYNEVNDEGFLYTLREILMMRVMNTITDKPHWDQKVFDEKVTDKWRQEISESGQDVTKAMMDWIIKELQWKAESLKKDGIVGVFDNGVVKSDNAIPKDLKQQLKEAVAPFEEVPDDQKDYHPGSDNKVLDLVHQSLFPVVYGRTHILRDKLIGLDDCLNSVGQGEVLQVRPKREASPRSWRGYPSHEAISRRFQWLPCDVRFSESEPGCRITSYMNNVHPVDHRALYGIIEKIIARAIPLWNKTLTPVSPWGERIQYGDDVKYVDGTEATEPTQGEDEDEQDYWDRCEAWAAARPIELPEPNVDWFKPPNQVRPDMCVNLREEYKDSGLQVIVKLANIELSPENPEYDGGSWHIEGQLNERICATAIYYYDSENITQSTLCFRHRAGKDLAQEFGYEQNRHEFLQQVYGFPGSGIYFEDHVDGMTQDLGGVVCREDRLLTFPNILQHRVSPFSLADRSKPGHRKILALFLIDPHVRIISSANVPPQQADWSKGRKNLIDELLGTRLPVELREMVRKDLPKSVMTLDEAKEYRLELMEERSIQTREQNEGFISGEFSLCEH
ncbi:uncharacterized protein N7498_004650 [Penicillium cinerascens]|uniref:Uncharacterized protein n=1 Tax=Penicillium cinerascens TaxID=70096 RepID=A0A9W9MLW9_9EURO|nr:uncharacterized protein N7498_004650 [Penicillium cinerascens]KAJ5203771.1 hypothetical protein N7498_004650 [Penicillium cinerascens]